MENSTLFLQLWLDSLCLVASYHEHSFSKESSNFLMERYEIWTKRKSKKKLTTKTQNIMTVIMF